MNRKINILLLFFLFTGFSISLHSQEITIMKIDSLNLQNNYLEEMESLNVFRHKPIEVSEDVVRNVLDRQPSFAVYRDNMMVTGIPTNEKVNSSSADVFFQLSIRQRVTKSVLPFNSFLYITYTQRSFWDIYEESSPFRDSNYNPGIGIGRYVIHDNKLRGAFMASLEHESNGRAELDSRSWNFVNLSAKYFYNMRLSAKAQVYIPYVDGENNQDLLKYRGYGVLSVDYIDKKNLWWLSIDAMPRSTNLSANMHISLSYKVSKNANQYLTLDFYNGYGESLLDYNKFSSRVRIGFTIKPDFFNAY